MEKINWNQSYELDIPEIDSQHLNLVFLINEVYSIIESENIEDKHDKTLVLIGKLLDYANYHFATEEKLFEENNYPSIESHKKKHEKFHLMITKYAELYNGGILELIDMVEFLTEWLFNHIAHEDKAFAHFVKNKKATLRQPF